MTLSEALDEFLCDRAASGISPRSVNNYLRTLRLSIRFLGENLPVSSLTWKMVQGYLQTLYSGHLAHDTARGYARNLKIFIKWLDGVQRLPFSHTRIKLPKAHKKQVTIYSVMEIEQIFDACKTYIPFVTARNRAFVSICLDCGLRREELTRIRLRDIRTAENGRYTLIVHGKGSKDRTVPFNEFSRTAVLKYVELCPHSISDYLFLTKIGTPVTIDTISQAFTDMQAKLPFALSAHKLRHNFATNYCMHSLKEHGYVDLMTLSILMGHEDIKTTQIYEHMARELLISGNAFSFMDENFLGEKSICLGNAPAASGDFVGTILTHVGTKS